MRRTPALTGIIAGLVALAIVVVLLTGGEDGRVVRAMFTSPAGLRAGDEVRVAGVPVGTVESIELDDAGGVAIASLRITDDSVTLAHDARAVARWRNLLGGPFYVELDTGSPSTGVDRSGLIPTSRTKAQVDFDQLLQPLDGRTAPALRTLVDQLGEGLAAPGAIRRDFRLLSPTMRSVRPGLAALEGERNDDLRELIRSTAKTVAGLGSDEDRLRALVDSAAGTFGATAARREDLGRLIADAPATLASTLTTVRRIDATLRHLDPLAEELRPGARRLEPALRVAQRTFIEAPRLLAEAEPLLRALDPALDSLERASRTGRGVVTGAKPIVARVDDRMLPWLARRDEGTGFRNVDILGPTFGGVNAAGAEFDREGHFLRFAPGAAPERPALSSPCQTFLGDPTAEQIVRCDALNQALDQIFGGPGRR